LPPLKWGPREDAHLAAVETWLAAEWRDDTEIEAMLAPDGYANAARAFGHSPLAWDKGRAILKAELKARRDRDKGRPVERAGDKVEPRRLDREHVKHLSETAKNKLRAEAFALVAKGQAASGGETLVLSEADAERLADLMRCGMLPSDPPPHKPITPERDKELRELARKRNEANRPNPEAHALAVKIAAAGGRDKARKEDVERFDFLMEHGGGGHAFPLLLNSLQEAERVRAHQAELMNEDFAEANERLAREKAEAEAKSGDVKALVREAVKEALDATAAPAKVETGTTKTIAKLTARLDTVLKVSGMDGKATRGQTIVEEVRKRLRDGKEPIDVCREIAREDYANACKTGAGRWLRKAKALAVNRAYVRGEEPSKADIEKLAQTLKRERNRALAITAPKAERARPRK
jgi:hypothetical protein